MHKAAGILSFFIIIIAGCHNRAAVLDFDELYDLIWQKPDIALISINQIDSTLLSSDEEKADYALLKTMALFRNYVDETSVDRIIKHPELLKKKDGDYENNDFKEQVLYYRC